MFYLFLQDIGKRDAWFSSGVDDHLVELSFALFSAHSVCFSFGDVSRLLFLLSRQRIEVVSNTVETACSTVFGCRVVATVATQAKGSAVRFHDGRGWMPFFPFFNFNFLDFLKKTDAWFLFSFNFHLQMDFYFRIDVFRRDAVRGYLCWKRVEFLWR